MNILLAPRTRRPRRPRKLTAALGGLGLASTLAFSGLVGERVQETEAAWTDTEMATAEVEASWPEAFVSVVAGSAKSSDTALNGTLLTTRNVTYESSFRWSQQLSQPENTVDTTSPDPGSNEKFHREFDQRLLGTGNPINDSSPHLLENTGSGIDTVTNALHNWRGSKSFANDNPTYPGTFRCLVINEDYASATNEDPRCGLGSNFAAASNTTDAYGFSIATGSAYITHLNAADLYTGVTCDETSAVAHAPTGRVDLGLERGGTNPYLSYTGAAANRVRTIWANGHTESPNGFSDLESGTVSESWRIGAAPLSDPRARVMPIITQEFSGPREQPYAISEIAAYVEVYNGNLIFPETVRAKMYFVLSRSECGVKRTDDAALPPQRSVFPSELPGGNELDPYNGAGYQPASHQAQPVVARAQQQSEATTSELPPATTVTSPTEHTTASETTTSAPPNAGEEDETSTSASSPTTSRSATTTRSSTSPAPTRVPTTSATATTSTPPMTTAAPSTSTTAPRIPSEPNALSPTARTATAATVNIDGKDHEVVARGTRAPADARTAAAALDTWINDGSQPTGNWKAFTSANPDKDGWRWAAINQVTGTIVYIR